MGLLVGLIVKRAISLVVFGIALIVVLSTAGGISLSVQSVYEKAIGYPPT